MTPKQRAFVKAFQGEARGNATEAARLAGYRHPRQMGSENLSKPDIQEAIGPGPTSNPDLANPEAIRLWWSEVMRDDSHSIRDRLRATELLAKSMGMFLDRHELTGRDGAPIAPPPDRIVICAVERGEDGELYHVDGHGNRLGPAS